VVWRVALAVALGLLLSAAIYFLAQALSMTSLAERPATCTLTGCFCEAPMGTVPKQIFDSLSSLAFVFLGVWSFLPAREPVKGTRERRVKPLFGVVFVFIGTSSFFYHSTLSFLGQFLDIFAMYAFGILLALGALYRAGKLSGAVSILLFGVLSVIFGIVQFEFPDARRILFAALLLPGVVLELTPFITGVSPRSPKVRFIYIGVGTLVVAYIIWMLDQTPFFCDPKSALQGHAVWHVLTAVAAFLIVAHYRQTPHIRTMR
jgi:predicted membrane channel-forming protein YqfA (hemolysin III family)